MIIGRSYRIKHIKGLLEDRLAIFRGPLSSMGMHFSSFDTIIQESSRYAAYTQTVLCDNEWSYHDSSLERVFKKVADTLADNLPEDVVGVIESLTLGPRPAGSGTYRYPL